MRKLFAFERDAYLRSLQTRVVKAGKDQRGHFVILEDTIFYPEGGGQPADSGTIAGVPVINVEKAADGVRHYTLNPVPQEDVRLELDWERRFDHMQHHTGQHLLSAVAEDRFGLRTTAFHLGSKLCDIELDVKELHQDRLAELEEEMMKEIRAARPVRAHWVMPEELGSLPRFRSRGLPERHQDLVRLVEIEGVDLATCGGTHLANTAEIECISLLATEPMRGGTRLYFVVGRRLRQRLKEHEARNAALRQLLGSPDEELAKACQVKLQRLDELTRLFRQTRKEFAVALGEKLSTRSEKIVAWHEPTADLAFLQTVAQKYLQLRPTGVLFLTGGQEPEGWFLLAARRPDLQELGQRLCQILGARGGGAGTIFQGKTTQITLREEALQALHQAL